MFLEKHSLEKQQRQINAERVAKGIKWRPNHFHLVGDKWVYNKPLH